MYEAAIKRAGLSMNRIIFSNTKMVMAGFPAAKPQQFNLSFKYKVYNDGRVTSMKSKSQNKRCIMNLIRVCLSCLAFTS